MALFDTITIAGGGKTYTFSGIEVNDEEDLKVKLDGGSVLSTPTDYTISGSQITFASGFSVTNGDQYVIYRDTKDDAARNQFYPSGSVRAQDLNKNFEQCLMAAEDKLPQIGAVLPDDIDMGGHKITNLKNEYTGKTLGDANDNDAVTAGWVKSFFFDTGAETIENTEPWVSDNLKVATTNAIDNRIDAKIDTAVVNDITFSGEFTKANDTPSTGQIQVSLTDNSVDLSKIKTADIVNKAEQDADGGTIPSAYVADDTKIPTMAAIIARHDNFVQNGTPSGDHQIGQFWFDDTNDKTLSVWNGSSWIGIASGGTFINQDRLIWVDAANGNDANDGHRVIKPMATIKAAVASADDGDMIFVQPGVYQEICPIDLGSKKNLSIIGMSMRSVFVHPTVATEENNMFLMGSGSFVSDLTLAGLKASGTRGGYTADSDSTYGLPENQAWYFAFSSNDGDGNAVKFFKSPYIQNVTAFADSGIDNSAFDPNLNANQPAFGGDTSSAMTGGCMIVDGSVPHADSPLRSMLTDAYTFVTLDGPGALVTNGGYAQLVSTFGTFCHYHAKALNGGQINMSNCVTDFGRYGLIADGKGPQIFTANTNALANSGQKIIEVGTSSNSFRNQSNPNPNDHMLVEITYDDSSTELIAIDSVTVTSGTSKTITLASNLARNVLSGTTLKFYLRSIITTGGHVFEFAGSGTDYLAHPDNGGQPNEANQVVDRNDGKVYISSTDHNGKFKIGPLTVETDGNRALYKGTELAASATSDTTDASNITSGTLDDARLPAASNTGTFAHPSSITVSAGGRVTAITQSTALEGATFEATADGDNVLLELKEDGTVVDTVKLVAGSGVTSTVNDAGQFTLGLSSSTANVTIGGSPPSGAASGDMWWDEDTGDSYIYYNDGNTSQWVQFAPQQTGTGNGTVTQVSAGTGLTGGNISETGTIALANTAVTAGSYGDEKKSVSITVDAQGRLTAASEQNIDLDASDVTSGTFDLARIPQLTDAKLPTSISTSRIPNLDAAKITTGTFTTARIPNLAGDGSATSTYLESLAADLSPQLGANLDVSTFKITSTSNRDIVLNADGTGTVVSQNNGFEWQEGTFVFHIKPPSAAPSSYELELPNTNGNNGEYLAVNATGKLYWDAETTYSLAGTNNSGAFRIQSTDSDGGSTAVEIKAGTGISLDNSTANETTISVTAGGVPTGTVQWFAGSSAPSGWLVCDGAKYSRSAEAALAAVIDVTYLSHYSGSGSVNSSTEFVVPDLRGEFIRGLDSSRGVDTGRGLGTTQTSQNLSHNHGGSTGSHSHNYDRTNGGTHCVQPGGACINIDSGRSGTSTGGAAASISSDGGSEARPRNIALLPIIKT